MVLCNCGGLQNDRRLVAYDRYTSRQNVKGGPHYWGPPLLGTPGGSPMCRSLAFDRVFTNPWHPKHKAG